MSTTHEPLRPSVDARRAFDELARTSIAEASTDGLLQRVADLARGTIPGVAEASVTLVSDDRAITAAFTGTLARDLDESQYGRGYGPCLESAVGQEIREMPDARGECPWPDYARDCVRHGALSSLSVPMPVWETVHGALNLYALEPRAFDEEANLARTCASYAAVAVGNVRLYETTRERAENLDIAMQHRAVIEQAKGILMSQRRCDAAEAFDLLAAASQRSNRKLCDIAAAMVQGVSGATT